MKMPLAINNLRIGQKYKLTNDGETHCFLVMEYLNQMNFKVKDLYTLEEYELIELIKYGKQKDYDLTEY